MSAYPENWLQVKLDELTEIKYGKDISLKSLEGFEEGYPVFGANGIIGFFNEYLYEDEQVLISCRGANSGKINISPAKSFITHNSLILETPINTKVFKKFLYYSLNSVDKSTIITGSAQPQVTITNAKNLKIPLAPLNEQHRIVEKLDKLLAKVESAKARLEKIPLLLKQFRQSVLSAAVSGAMTKDWREENTDVESADLLLNRLIQNRQQKYNELCDKAKVSNLRKPKRPRGLKESNKSVIRDGSILPFTWISTIIDNIADVEIGGTPSRKIAEYWNGNIKWVSSGEVANNMIYDTSETITDFGLKKSSVKVYPTGTVLLAMIGEGKTRGQSSILKIPAGTNQNVAGILLNNNFVVSKYIWYLFLLNYDKTRSNSIGGNQPALNGIKVGQLNVLLPPFEEQKVIVKRVKALFQTADQVEVRYQKAKTYMDKLQQSILAKAFLGELVPQDPNDLPASVLLERIRAEKEK